jgi:hypothetical protein
MDGSRSCNRSATNALNVRQPMNAPCVYPEFAANSSSRRSASGMLKGKSKVTMRTGRVSNSPSSSFALQPGGRTRAAARCRRSHRLALPVGDRLCGDRNDLPALVACAPRGAEVHADDSVGSGRHYRPRRSTASEGAPTGMPSYCPSFTKCGSPEPRDRPWRRRRTRAPRRRRGRR